MASKRVIMKDVQGTLIETTETTIYVRDPSTWDARVFVCGCCQQEVLLAEVGAECHGCHAVVVSVA